MNFKISCPRPAGCSPNPTGPSLTDWIRLVYWGGRSKDNVSTAPKQGKRNIEVRILGQRMVLKVDEDPNRIERLASYVRRKVDEVSASSPISSQKLAILAALNIADDYFRALDEAREFKRQVAVKSRALLSDLDP